MTTRLIGGDIALLHQVVEYCGGFSGGAFKQRLVEALNSSQDGSRLERLRPVVKRLDENEIRWLCENGENIRRRRRRP